MRRLAFLAVLFSCATAGAAALLATSAQGSSSYRVDAIFDDARGLIPGQVVKIAGAKVGTITDVTLTADFKARIEMTVDGSFAPFHSDAACTIQPEGLIAENFVGCSPGTSAAGPLQSSARTAPTVPVSHNTEPVSITDLFNVWNTPTRDRVAVLVNDLGAGLAGQGEALNSVLYRANPALAVARKAITLLNNQRTQLQQIVTATDPIVAKLAQRSPAVQQFLAGAARVAQTSAAHRDPLAQAINRLPSLLEAARPALQKLDALAAAGGPILTDVHAAAPNINRVVADLRPFGAAAIPALRKLGPALANTTATLTQAAPVIGKLRTFASASNTPGQQLAQLAVSLRDRGVVDNLMAFAYDAAGLLTRFDVVSHVAIANVLLPVTGCIFYATAPASGCSAWYPNGAQRYALVHKRHAAPRNGGRSSTSPAAAPTAGKPSVGPAKNPLNGVAPAAPGLLQSIVQQTQSLVSKLLPGVGQPPHPSSTSPGTPPIKSLLDYLLGR